MLGLTAPRHSLCSPHRILAGPAQPAQLAPAGFHIVRMQRAARSDHLPPPQGSPPQLAQYHTSLPAHQLSCCAYIQEEGDPLTTQEDGSVARFSQSGPYCQGVGWERCYDSSERISPQLVCGLATGFPSPAQDPPSHRALGAQKDRHAAPLSA